MGRFCCCCLSALPVHPGVNSFVDTKSWWWPLSPLQRTDNTHRQNWNAKFLWMDLEETGQCQSLPELKAFHGIVRCCCCVFKTNTLCMFGGKTYTHSVSLDSREKIFVSHHSPPRFRRGYPLNLSISVSGGKETNRDILSRGDRKG